MSINVPSELTAEANRGKSDGRFPGVLRAVALTGVLAGAAGSLGLMLWVGHRNPSRLLLALFVVWDLSPFMALLLADLVSKRWSVVTRSTLHIVMLVVALSSLALYGDVVLRPRSQAAFMFLVVPLGSWLLMAIVVPIAALVSGRRSRR
ncbi:MAG TPA: hypothetical protein VEM96_16730 [Pyrinomonadaceae bacterium]|nr:hypothetical protein [Pyrinomonadaceae bacterium]